MLPGRSKEAFTVKASELNIDVGPDQESNLRHAYRRRKNQTISYKDSTTMVTFVFVINLGLLST